MCHASCILFGVKSISEEEIRGKRVIEVGSCNVNGSLRSLIELWKPAEYIGIDISSGPCVDVICNAENIVEKFGPGSFDVVISAELLEHTKNWRTVISNIKNICKPDGLILITTRSQGFAYHAYPHDFWRYEIEDMKHIFSDGEILTLEKDPQEPGVFIKVRKPAEFIENDLSDYKLYNIVANKRTKTITKKDFISIHFIRLFFKKSIYKIVSWLLHEI